MTEVQTATEPRLEDLRALPKVELHRHLEGAVRLQTVIDLSRDAGLDLPAWTTHELAPFALITSPVASLEEALARFAISQNAVRTLGAVRRIAREAVEDLAAENVRLGELRFSPHFLCQTGGLDWDAAIDAVWDGVQEGVSANDVAVGLVAIFSRDYGMESAEATVAFALRHHDRLVGFDVAGSELGFPPSMYAAALAPLRDSDLGLTVHYGESGPPEYPREAVEVLRPTRLGHGLSVAWDPAVTELVIDHHVTLEMCPTSNWLTQGVRRVADHPARRLLHDGVAVTLNTDDPGIMGVDLTHEFETARDELGFGWDDLRRVTANALDATFLPPHIAETVRARHFAWV
jgi:adenosine deaminase